MQSLEHSTILIIDDDPDDRELLVEAVKEINPAVTCDIAVGSIEALKMLDNDLLKVPDFIFLDLNMPMMNGKECLMEMNKLNHLEESVIVIYTTSQREDDILEMLELGATYFLIKPSIFMQLKDAIQYILSGDTTVITIEGLFRRSL